MAERLGRGLQIRLQRFNSASHLQTKDGEIAQLVERRTHKPKVKGSIPFLATTSK